MDNPHSVAHMAIGVDETPQEPHVGLYDRVRSSE